MPDACCGLRAVGMRVVCSLGEELAGRTGGRCVRGVKWPTTSEVLGGTHSQWGLGKGLEPPHTRNLHRWELWSRREVGTVVGLGCRIAAERVLQGLSVGGRAGAGRGW